MFFTRYLVIVTAFQYSHLLALVDQPVQDALRSLSSSKTATLMLLTSERSRENFVSWSRHYNWAFQTRSKLDGRLITELKGYTEQDENIVVLVAYPTWQQRKYILDALESEAYQLSLVRYLFILDPGESLPYGDYPLVSCALLVVNGTHADVPEDRFRNCTRRSAAQPRDLFERGTSKGWSTLRNKTFVVANRRISTEGKLIHHYDNFSDASAIMSALFVLNVSVIPRAFVYEGRGVKKNEKVTDALEKKIDMSVLSAPMIASSRKLISFSGITYWQCLTFYSLRKEKVPASLPSAWRSNSLNLALLLVCSGSVIAVYFVQSKMSRQVSSCSGMALFLLSNFLGRSTLFPPLSNLVPIRLLCLFWMVGTLALGIYIQTEVMSTISVPSYSESIETMEDLKKATDARKILPCVNKGMRSASFIQGSKTGVAKTLGSLMREHPDCCIFPGEGNMCYRLAQNGTHVYILVRLPHFRRRGEQYRLSPSEECFVVEYGTTYISKAFPHKEEYHRLITAVIEAGLHIFHERNAAKRATQDSLNELITIDLTTQLVFFAWCSCFLCIVFICELLAYATKRYTTLF